MKQREISSVGERYLDGGVLKDKIQLKGDRGLSADGAIISHRNVDGPEGLLRFKRIRSHSGRDGGRLELPDIGRKIKAAALMQGGPVKVEQSAVRLVLNFDPSASDAIDTIIRLELDGSAMDLPAHPVASGIKATASNVYQRMEDEYGPAEAFDNDAETRWATDSGTKKAWIAVDLGENPSPSSEFASTRPMPTAFRSSSSNTGKMAPGRRFSPAQPSGAGSRRNSTPSRRRNFASRSLMLPTGP